jgi:hypothetical protein
MARDEKLPYAGLSTTAISLLFVVYIYLKLGIAK